MTPTELLDAFDIWGVDYFEHPGWRDHNRNGHGGNERNGIMIHHTGMNNPPSVQTKVLWNGRSDLPGPLCNWGQTLMGRAILIGNGRANHAGEGSSITLNRIVNEDYRLRDELVPGPDNTDGNAHLYGQESMYDGSRPMSKRMYRNTQLCCAAVCDFHGWSAKSVIGHREWTRRKPDPGHLNMGDFRSDLRNLLNTGPTKR